ELRRKLAACGLRHDFTICVGVNGTSDRSAEVAREQGAEVAVTPRLGYGHGCQAAIDHLQRGSLVPDAYIFMAADGANDPTDLPRLLAAHADGFPFVLGCRTDGFRNVHGAMTFTHWVANRLLGIWCGLLTGRFFFDLGPFRLIDRQVFQEFEMREWTYGWTIEPQILAARQRVPMLEVPVRERARLAGEQKVSGVSIRRTISIGVQIFAAAWRARLRLLPGGARAVLSARPSLLPNTKSACEP
ncbi:hypothetical protein AYO41_01535, partial [Verrucomicrobia bacterium SCGC AG-212-E04]